MCLDFAGISTERIQFSWVSAAEGSKWADVVNNTVKKIRELGPYKEYQNLSKKVFIEGGQKMIEVIKKAKELLDNKSVQVVIGYGEGAFGKTRAIFVRDSAQADKLMFDDRW